MSTAKTSSRKASPARRTSAALAVREKGNIEQRIDKAIAQAVAVHALRASHQWDVGGIQVAAPPPRQPYPEPPAPAPERPSMLLDALHSLSRRVDEAYAALEGLESAASMILVPEPPSPAGGEGSANGAHVTQAPAIDMIQGITGAIERLTIRMTVVTGRVQA